MVHIRHRTGPRFNKQRSPVSVRPNAKYGVNDVQIQIRICRCVLLWEHLATLAHLGKKDGEGREGSSINQTYGCG